MAGTTHGFRPIYFEDGSAEWELRISDAQKRLLNLALLEAEKLALTENDMAHANELDRFRCFLYGEKK